LPRSNSLELMKAARMMMAMLMELLATTNVLSRRSGLDRSLITVAECFALPFCSFSRSPGVSEKYATSDPEIEAEAIIRKPRMINSVTRVAEVPVIAASAKNPEREPDISVSNIQTFG